MVCELDLEGIVAKRKSAAYRATEKPSPYWIKINNRNYTQAEGREDLFDPEHRIVRVQRSRSEYRFRQPIGGTTSLRFYFEMDLTPTGMTDRRYKEDPDRAVGSSGFGTSVMCPSGRGLEYYNPTCVGVVFGHCSWP
jgi:hypothetical protein